MRQPAGPRLALAAAVLLPIASLGADAGKKQAAVAIVEQHRAALIGLSQEIWAAAETALRETQSARVLAEYAEKQGLSRERFEVIGFGVDRGRPAVRTGQGPPDTRWFGHDPRLLVELRGEAAESAMPRLRAAVADYPYPRSYTASD